MHIQDTIAALATAPGAGAIAVIRVSGTDAIPVVSSVFRAKSGKVLADQESHTLHLGNIVDGSRIIDEALVSLFKGKRSYTGEPTVEISCHGSSYIQQEILQLLFRKGCRAAKAGEFTLRAFINGKMDLSQAEAVADLIASDNAGAHQIAMQQMRGGFSNEIAQLRQELLNFASLIELELDFAEEDVEFANREEFQNLISKITRVLKRLIDSFATGNVIKNGIPVAIVGEPNVGKSTLLNALLNEERAIVSDIAGTTRDTIEDELSIGGIGFRFIDTAGIRETTDVIEGLGIKKTFEKISQAQVVLYLINAESPSAFGSSPKGGAFPLLRLEIEKIKNRFPDKPLVLVANKMDHLNAEEQQTIHNQLSELIPEDSKSTVLLISAKTGTGVDELKEQLLQFVNTGALRNNETLVTNSRHYDALLKALEEIEKVQMGIDAGLSGDLLAIDIREALYHFGEITGQVTNDELLGNIFANFCIGK
ncbi:MULTISPECIES: tRNA uridine-5-carboxymethylaminomethyl(34) synthesis GTPase MnmE [unclassified Leeuwenhoekiella]|uniref:tRNA uridine-5-carboxymethylaminomethyl(34) synthesis GTPase MnmE n=1 Tax=unclassified Leeuwenhoekiella TaxID=2615029 RepID=UPI000C5F8973|nr:MULTISPECIES: tRNA uridine-5-carboxymethylaminomethyl(34) synthesis GTPase MnmE [unclassified Leeuwenhoekiella]MAW94072.1 tRNA uridine-5-carboxymethylaminomethyl(34) synthesis GTPase MnmE [Leeuwenhoekiella sp.]MBA80889.1 tRNA uridine-5-carboxymethylaminomethyl(34) synthesis GTPase MnmE [Leeuwenhoekiella sp.]|tara:strand:- start:74494 stop:75933 length:1440 start_codon:yes stop_codon:yes gene_type:complete